jgi:hypothetical protein
LAFRNLTGPLLDRAFPRGGRRRHQDPVQLPHAPTAAAAQLEGSPAQAHDARHVQVNIQRLGQLLDGDRQPAPEGRHAPQLLSRPRRLAVSIHNIKESRCWAGLT